MAGVAWLDWFFLGVMIASMLVGAWRGLVYELLSLLSWVAAFVLAQCFAESAGARLPWHGMDALRYPLGFVLVFVVSVFLGGWVAWLGQKLMQALQLSPADRSLGALFGWIRACVMLMACAALVNLTSFKDEEAWRQSVGAGVMTSALKVMKPVLPERFGQYLPT